MNAPETLDYALAGFRYLETKGLVPVTLVNQPALAKPESFPIYVVFTGMQETQLALQRAAELATDLAAETRVIVPHVVPYPMALECPVVPLEFLCGQIKMLAAEAGADPYIHIYFCRDVTSLLCKLLQPGSIVVLGTRKGWLWPSKTERLARKLQKHGCATVLA